MLYFGYFDDSDSLISVVSTSDYNEPFFLLNRSIFSSEGYSEKEITQEDFEIFDSIID